MSSEKKANHDNIYKGLLLFPGDTTPIKMGTHMSSENEKLSNRLKIKFSNPKSSKRVHNLLN
jgi:hypothetical protein